MVPDDPPRDHVPVNRLLISRPEEDAATAQTCPLIAVPFCTKLTVPQLNEPQLVIHSPFQLATAGAAVGGECGRAGAGTLITTVKLPNTDPFVGLETPAAFVLAWRASVRPG